MGAGLFGMALATGISAAQGFRGRAKSTVARPRSGNEGIVQGKAKLEQLQEQISKVPKKDEVQVSVAPSKTVLTGGPARSDASPEFREFNRRANLIEQMSQRTPVVPASPGYRDFNRSVNQLQEQLKADELTTIDLPWGRVNVGRQGRPSSQPQFEKAKESVGTALTSYVKEQGMPIVFNLTGRVGDLNLPRQRMKQLGVTADTQAFPSKVNREDALNRINATAGSNTWQPTFEEKQLLLDRTVPTSDPRISRVLSKVNPTYEISASKGTVPLTLSEEGEMMKAMGAEGATGTRTTMNPEYEKRWVNFVRDWDVLASKGYVAPRESLINGQPVKYQEAKLMASTPQDKQLYEISGKKLNQLARQHGLDEVPETIVDTQEPRNLLQEVKTTTDRRQKGGKSILVEEVRDGQKLNPNIGTRERKLIRQGSGLETRPTTELKKISQLPTPAKVSAPGSIAAQVGGYRTAEPVQVFDFDTVSIIVNEKTKNPQMVPYSVVKSELTGQGQLLPIGNLKQVQNMKTTTYDPSSPTLDVQPYSVTKVVQEKTALAKQTGQPGGVESFVTSVPIYGKLKQRVDGKLKNAKLPMDRVRGLMSQAKQQVDASLEPVDPKTYYSQIADISYEKIKAPQQAGGLGTDLPVLQDMYIKSQFVKDVLKLEGESKVFGRRSVGGQTATGRDRGAWDKALNEPTEARELTGVKTAGLGGIDKSLVEGSADDAVWGVPRLEMRTDPPPDQRKRVTALQTLQGQNLTLDAATKDTLQLLKSAKSSQGKLASKEQYQNIVSNVSNMYQQKGAKDVTPNSITQAILSLRAKGKERKASPEQMQARTQDARNVGSQSKGQTYVTGQSTPLSQKDLLNWQGPATLLSQKEEVLSAERDAAVRTHLANYVAFTHANLKGDKPGEIGRIVAQPGKQGNKLKKSLRPYQPPSETMIEQLIRTSRARSQS
jgi:hypothetical protein